MRHPPPGHATVGALARCVDDVDVFAHDVWGTRPLRWCARDPSGFSDVFGLEIADRLLASAVRHPTVRLVDAGSNLDVSSYTSRLRLGGRWMDDVVDRDKVATRFRDGATVVFQSLHRTCDEVRRFVSELSVDVSHPLQANAYLTPAGATGLAPHRDRHDVLVLHLAGRKHWHVEGLGEVELNAGDTMYVPAGVEHSATAAAQMSLHLTIGIIRTTYRSVVARLLDGVPGLDAPLPLRYAGAGSGATVPTDDVLLADSIERAVAASVARLGSVDADDVAVRERRRRRAPGRSGTTMSSLAAAETVGTDTFVSWSCAATPSHAEHDDPDQRLRLAHNGLVIRLPGVTGAALNQLSAERRCRVGDLIGLDADSQVVLVRRLVEDGVCAVV